VLRNLKICKYSDPAVTLKNVNWKEERNNERELERKHEEEVSHFDEGNVMSCNSV